MSQKPATSGSNLVAAGIFLSRIAGIVRTVVIGVVLGSGSAADSFSFAMRVPNLLQNLLGEGSLSASFIPVYARLVEEGDEKRASALAGAVLSILALVTGVIVLIVVLAARPLVWLFTDWESDPARYELTIELFRVTTIGIGFLVISAWCLGVLNSHRSFFLSYAAPVLWNLAQIIALVVAAAAALSMADGAVLLAWAVVIGGLLQVAIQIPRVRGFVPSLRPSLRRDGLVNDVIRRFLPAVGARGVVQVSSFVDTFFLTLLVGGAASFYLYALPLYVTPISLFGFSVAAAELAEMSRRSQQLNALAARITPALRKTVVPAGFVTAAYLAAGPTWTDALYGWISRLLSRGLTDPAGILVIGYLLMAMAIGLPAAITARVTQNTLYSLGDVRGPARIALVRVMISVAASYLLMLQLDWLTFEGTSIVEFDAFPHWPAWEQVPESRRALAGVTPHLGVVGIGLGSSIAAWVEWTLLRVRLRSRLGGAGAGAVSSDWGLNVFIAGVGAGAAMFMATLVPLPSPVDAIVTALIGLGVYGSLLWIQGIKPTSRLRSSA
ncbi:MAG: murein biosynthesis integral membrane protein MurJ [Acidimicrobiia bacterium]|nr:murein biosynthesis integral membrane protein MurJ [Acidimicrobiia bacterium]